MEFLFVFLAGSGTGLYVSLLLLHLVRKSCTPEERAYLDRHPEANKAIG